MELIDRIVAVVDEKPLLLSEVRTLAAVREVGEAEALEAAIDELLMYAEASRVAPVEVAPEEEREALAALARDHPSLGSSLPEIDLRRLVRRQIAILRYVEFRFRPQVQVSDEEVRTEWAQAAGASTSFENAQPAIRARLERRALDERIEAWVKELRARADVRRTAPPSSSEDTFPPADSPKAVLPEFPAAASLPADP